MKEIVAALIGQYVYNDPVHITQVVRSGRQDITFLDRKHMEMMAACDVGDNWKKLACGQTILHIDDKGEVKWGAPNKDELK
jgi:hypothetical protein